MKTLSINDKIKIEQYRKKLDKYEKPSVTADIVAVRPAFGELREDQWRENPKFAMELLLIKRGAWPHEGCWALPGGFIHSTESVEDGARRELMEETSLKVDNLIPVGTFSNPGRDMRGWIISNAFVSVHRRGEVSRVKGGDDAAEAAWLCVENPVFKDGKFSLSFYEGEKKAFDLSGTYRPEEFYGGMVTSVKKNPLAFDHGAIIAQAFLRLLSFDLKKLVFFFLPEKFTLSDYIGVYQYLTGNSITPGNIPNFRRQLTSTKDPVLEICEGEFEKLDGRGHAAAKLYRKKN